MTVIRLTEIPKMIRISVNNIRTTTDGFPWGRHAPDSRILQRFGVTWQKFTDDPKLSVAEAWFACDDVKHPSGVLIGRSGLDLRQLLDQHGEAILGAEHFKRFGPYMASVMKILDARESLSVQIHPALGHPTRPAKPEMWFFEDADPRIYLGWSQDVTADIIRAARQKAIDTGNNNEFERLLMDFRVSQNSLVNVFGGLVHAIRGSTTVWEWSHAPARDEISKGDIKKATVSPWDRTDGKHPRDGKEDIDATIDVLNDAATRANHPAYKRLDPRSVIRERTRHDYNGISVDQLFEHDGINVSQIYVLPGWNAHFDCSYQGFPLFIRSGTGKLLDSSRRFLGSLTRNDLVLLPSFLKSFHIENTGSQPLEFFRWNAEL